MKIASIGPSRQRSLSAKFRRRPSISEYSPTPGRATLTGVASPYPPTVAIRRLFVPPEVPNGTPATTMMRSPGPAKPSI